MEKDGLAAYDVDSGGLYWQIDDLSPWDEAWFDGVHLPVTLGELGRTYKTDRFGYIYIFRDARLDVNTGETLWGSPLTRRYGPSMVVDDRVVFWNPDQPNIIHCVDTLYGHTLWDFDPLESRV